MKTTDMFGNQNGDRRHLIGNKKVLKLLFLITQYKE